MAETKDSREKAQKTQKVFCLCSAIVESHSFWRRFGRGMRGRGIGRRPHLGIIPLPLIPLPVPGLPKKKKAGQKMESIKFLFLYFPPPSF
jgi:hypothetical protein